MQDNKCLFIVCVNQSPSHCWCFLTSCRLKYIICESWACSSSYPSVLFTTQPIQPVPCNVRGWCRKFTEQTSWKNPFGLCVWAGLQNAVILSRHISVFRSGVSPHCDSPVEVTPSYYFLTEVDPLKMLNAALSPELLSGPNTIGWVTPTAFV